MKSGATINQTDLKKLNDKFSHLKGFDKALDMELRRGVKTAENLAVQDFKKEFNQRTGEGRSSIISGKDKKNTYFVRALKKYMAYLEFGTITKVDLSPLDDLGIDRSYASQFKGKGKRKTGGIRAGHYFFPNVKKAYDMMIKRLEKGLSKAINK
jgi:hypothetical protein